MLISPCNFRRAETLELNPLSLDAADQGSVYSAGFGALGLGPKTLESQIVRRIDSLEDQGISRIRAGWGWAAAVRGESSPPVGKPAVISHLPLTDDGKRSSIFSWGLNNQHGRLGVGTVPASARAAPSSTPPAPTVPMHIYEPTELALPIQKLGVNDGDWELGQVECGQDALWLELREFDAQNEVE